MMYDLVIHESATLLEALKAIDANRKGFLVVVNEGCFSGTLTDGDIRRALINGANLETAIIEIYNRSCETLSIYNDMSDLIKTLSEPKIKFIPIVDDYGKLINVITERQLQLALLHNLKVGLTYDFSSLDESALDYSIVAKPWGFYRTTVINDFYQSKVLQLLPEASISLQRHKLREEYWITVYGEGEAIIGDSVKGLYPGTDIFIPKNCIHRLTNSSCIETLVVVEVQLGESFDEDDIERFSDEK